MDGRQAYPDTLERGPHQAPQQDYVLPRQFRMMGSHEHDMLVAQGHYRCPHCRRADTMEARGMGLSRQ